MNERITSPSNISRLVAAATLVLTIPLVAGVPQHEIAIYTIDGGGGSSAGSGYELTGTIAQHDAHMLSSGSGYELSGGFWHHSVCPDFGDCDCDGDIDAGDLADMEMCLLGPNASLLSECECLDLDDDGDNDLKDFQIFQQVAN